KEKKDVKIYNATEDAIALADALARNPADCDVLVDILPALSRDQMFDLRSEYEGYCKTEEHDGNLAECIKLRVGGVFGEICYATVLGQYESEGYWVERACSSNLMALSMLGGALFGRPNIEIQEIKDKFRSVKYRSSLTQLVEDRLEVDQARRIALVALAAERQGESDTRPDEYRDSDVDELHRAIDGRYDSQLLWRIMLRSDAQLREVLKEYTRKYRINLPLKILWMSYDPALVIISYILIGVMNRPARDAQSLYDALMALTKSELKESRMSLENDEEWKFQLLASILVRAHWDRRHLKNVKIEYEEKYQSTVELDLVNATTGYFREFCLGLVRTET
ncbi:Annexin, partial [Glonium stellatum]